MVSSNLILFSIIGTVGVFLLILGIVFINIKYNQRLLKLQLSKQRELLAAEIKAKEAEQVRIARGLHDDLGGNLTVLGLTVHDLYNRIGENEAVKRELTKLKDLISKTHQNVRDVSRDLLSNDIEKYGLIHSLNELLDHSGIDQYEIGEVDEGILEKDQKIAIYRMVQEVLNNARKHSKCMKFDVFFEQIDDLKIMIEFDGEIFDYKNSRLTSAGLGLKNIESRVDFLSGKIQYSSSDNLNTYLVSVPLKK